MKANFLRSLYRDYIASIRFRIKCIFSYITEKFCDIRNTDIGYFELFSISVLSSDAVVFRRYSRYVFQNFAIFTGKHLWRSLFLIKLQGWRSATLLKRGSNTVVFLWILKKFFGFFIENHGDCSSRILYFNECLWIFQIFSSRKYIPVS